MLATQRLGYEFADSRTQRKLQRQFKYTNYFFIFLIIFSTGSILEIDIAGQTTIFSLIQVIGLFGLVISGYILFEYKAGNKYFLRVFTCLIIWNLFTVLKGFHASYGEIKYDLVVTYVFWPFVVPVVSFFPKTASFFRGLFTWLFFMAVFFMPMCLATYQNFLITKEVAEQIIWCFACGSGFIMLTWNYHTLGRRALAVAVNAASLVIVLIIAKRNLTITIAGYFLCSFFLLMIRKGTLAGSIKKIFYAISFLIVCAFGTFYFLQNKKTDFKAITQRVGDNTRENVFYYFFIDMSSHMLTGKGMNGTYYCPVDAPDNPTPTGDFTRPVDDRDVIECGYFQLILNGGLISVFLFLVTVLPAAYLGIFKSKNTLCKAAGFIILLWLIDMVPFGLPVLSTRYILVWICVGVCYSKEMRLISEDVMMQNFRGKGRRVI